MTDISAMEPVCEEHQWIHIHQDNLPIYWIVQCSICHRFESNEMLEEISRSGFMIESDRQARAYGFEVGRGHPLTSQIYPLSKDNPFSDVNWRDRIND